LQFTSNYPNQTLSLHYGRQREDMQPPPGLHPANKQPQKFTGGVLATRQGA